MNAVMIMPARSSECRRAAGWLPALAVACSILMVGCKKITITAPPTLPPSMPAQTASFYSANFSKTPSVYAMTELGRLLFFDVSLSASGRLACASCHDPQFAFGPSDASAVQQGGAAATQTGVRAAPSLRYLQTVPSFSEHHFDEAVDESVDQGPTGGRMWDGRADSAHDQARLPLLSPLEMANDQPADVVAKVRRSSSAALMREVFGATVFDDESGAFKAILMSLEVYQQNPKDFYPYDSKYDSWLRGRATLSPAEMRGLRVFTDSKKGNCASCHPNQIQNGSFPQFTDFGFIALGVPRNSEIPANRDDGYFDLGLCGPERVDLRSHDDYCGRFRAPTLRNVALRNTFFHNGAFHSLRKVVEFYAERDTNPEKYYPRAAGGAVQKYDDLPARYRGNVNREAPFGGRPGDAPAFSPRDVTDLLAFLGALTDGYRPAQDGERHGRGRASAGLTAAPSNPVPLITSAGLSPRSMSRPVKRQL